MGMKLSDQGLPSSGQKMEIFLPFPFPFFFCVCLFPPSLFVPETNEEQTIQLQHQRQSGGATPCGANGVQTGLNKTNTRVMLCAFYKTSTSLNCCICCTFP